MYAEYFKSLVKDFNVDLEKKLGVISYLEFFSKLYIFFPNFKLEEGEKKLKIDFDFLVFFLFNFISFLEKEENLNHDLIFFLKEIFFIFDSSDFKSFFFKFDFLIKKLNFFLSSLKKEDKIFFGLNFLNLFFVIFNERFYKTNLKTVFKKRDDKHLTYFLNSGLTSEEIDFVSELMNILVIVTKKVEDLWMFDLIF